MKNATALRQLLDHRQIWPAQGAVPAELGVPTGLAALDAALPLGGWPPGALTEVLHPGCGLGELQLLLPTIARLTRSKQRVVLISPPFLPYARAWVAAGVRLDWLDIIEAEGRERLWAFEQCLRSGSCAAVIGWPAQADHAALRRLQLAADQGQCLGFLLRHSRHAAQHSPAALRVQLLADASLQVLKCRGGARPTRPIGLRPADPLSNEPSEQPGTRALLPATRSSRLRHAAGACAALSLPAVWHSANDALAG